MNRVISIATVILCTLIVNFSSNVSADSASREAIDHDAFMQLMKLDFEQIFKIAPNYNEAKMSSIRAQLAAIGVGVTLTYSRNAKGDIKELSIESGTGSKCSSTDFGGGLITIYEKGVIGCSIGDKATF